MPRDLPLGNGSLLVAFDWLYQIRDIYWPHVGQENHGVGHPFRLGIWVDGQFTWVEDEQWQRDLKYQDDTLVTLVKLYHPGLKLEIQANDAVDFHENLFVRRFEVTNLDDQEREIRMFFHHDFHISGNDVGDTAYYEPERRAIIHYKGARWFMINGAVSVDNNDPAPGWIATEDTSPGIVVGVHQWACGLKEIHNLQGTWRDAEDGWLSGNPVAHGSVDSTIGLGVKVPAKQTRTLYYWLAAGLDFESVTIINRLVRQRGPQFFIDRTTAFWHLWIDRHLPSFNGLSPEVITQYKRSLLIIRTQIDNNGGILAANDSDISSDVRDTYSYVWPRDGALVAHALNLAGYLDLPRAFYQFCQRALTRQGYLLHKYNPDGTLASSWHPWYHDNTKELPIQEDETALVIWALWRHFDCFGDVFFIKPLYRSLICPIGDFLAAYRDPQTCLPLPSYDLWEERRGVSAWTSAAVWGGLQAAANFAEAFGEDKRAQRYRQAAAELKEAVDTYLWDPERACFLRMVNPQDHGSWQIDATPDSSMIGLWKFGMYTPDDPKISSTMKMIQERLWVKTKVGGIARYEHDHYQRPNDDHGDIPGNPWIICTLWTAEYYVSIAKSIEELKPALFLIEWACQRSLPSGVMAEQIHPYTNAPLSVSPLTWSHATFVNTVQVYLKSTLRLE